MKLPKESALSAPQTQAVTYWEGQLISEMSRADLEAAFVTLGKAYTEALESRARTRRVLSLYPALKAWAN